MEDQDCIAVIAMARLLGAPDILPCTFYQCCLLNLTDILDGVTYGAEKVVLSADDLRRCLAGYGRLLEVNKELMQVLPDLCAAKRMVSQCKTTSTCLASLRKVMAERHACGDFHSVDTLASIVGNLDDWNDEHPNEKICKHCRDDIEQEQEGVRSKTFLELTSTFEL